MTSTPSRSIGVPYTRCTVMVSVARARISWMSMSPPVRRSTRRCGRRRAPRAVLLLPFLRRRVGAMRRGAEQPRQLSAHVGDRPAAVVALDQVAPLERSEVLDAPAAHLECLTADPLRVRRGEIRRELRHVDGALMVE